MPKPSADRQYRIMQLAARFAAIKLPARLLLTMTLGISTGFPIQPSIAADDKIPVVVLHHTDETDADLERIDFVLTHIPKPVQKTIAAKGISIVLTPLMTYDQPESSGEKVFRNGGTIDNVGGEFQPRNHRVIVPERASWKNSPPRPQGNYLKKVLPHEIGHAFDNACGGLSRSAEYKAAYEADFSRFSNSDLTKFSYNITGTSTSEANVPTDSGRGECFANAFARLVGPVNDRNKDGFAAAFSHVLAFIEGYEPSLKDACWQPEPAKKTEQPAKPLIDSSETPAQHEIDAAIVLLKQERWSDSIKVLDRAIKLDPTCQKAFALKGNAEVWLKNYRGAIADYSAFIKLAPDDPQGYSLRARAYGWLGDRTKQEQDENRAKRRSNFVPK